MNQTKKLLKLLPALVLAAFVFMTGIKINFATVFASEGTTLSIDLSQDEGASGTGIHDVADTLYGIFFEDINHGADGGMSAEMVVNQSFQFEYITYNSSQKAIADDNLRWWKIDPSVVDFGIREIMTSGAMSANNSKYLRVEAKVKGYKLFNAGFQGDDFSAVGSGYYVAPNLDDYAMNVVKDREYEFSVYVKQEKSKPYSGSLDLYLRNLEGEKVSTTLKLDFDANTPTTWQKYSGRLTGTVDDLGALVLDFQGKGMIGLDFVSLMPIDAYGFNDPRFSGGHIKKEIVDIFAAMNPRFLRFPGGCVAEGDVSWDNVYDWQRTVGPLTDRRGTPNTWEYYQSFNIGFYEYFLLCEDLNMKAMPVVSAGLICQARMGENGALIYKYDHPDFLEQVVNKALHLIYFAKGDVNSPDPDEAKWAKVRADMGHPEPLSLEYISLGNENWGRAYWDNFEVAVDMLRNYDYAYYQGQNVDMLEKWGITIVTTSGTYHSDAAYHAAWKEINGGSAANVKNSAKYTDMVVDEHYYETSAWYRNNINRYDSYSRDGAKVFVGEYSANQPSSSTVNTLEAALAEAAYMTGLEKNSDIVIMASYAPFFGRKGNSQWQTNAIWLNAKNIMLTPNYYVQQMYGEAVGDKYIPAQFSDNLSGMYQSVTLDTAKNQVIVKLVNTGNTDRNITIDLSSVDNVRGYYYGKKMQHDNQNIRNELADDYDGDVIENVAPVKLNKTTFTNSKAGYNVEKYSVNVLIFPLGEEGTDNTLSSIRLVGGEMPAFNKDTTEYKVTLPSNSAVPYLYATATDSRADVKIEYAANMAGQTLITVTAENGSQKTYTLTYGVPQSSGGGGGDDGGKKGCKSEVSAVTTIVPIIVLCAVLYALNIKKSKKFFRRKI